MIKKIVIGVLIFFITFFMIGNYNIVSAGFLDWIDGLLSGDSEEGPQCLDVKKDDYELDSNIGIKLFKNAAGDITDEHFVDYYRFFVDGVDIEKVKKEGLEEDYIKALNTISDKMENTQSANTNPGIQDGFDVKKALGIKNDKEWQTEIDKVEKTLDSLGATTEQKAEIKESFDDVDKMQEASESTNAEDRTEAVIEATENNDDTDELFNDKIFKWPTVGEATGKTKDGTLSDMISDADSFLQAGENNKITQDDLKSLSRSLYNILLQIGVGLSVIIGLVLGIKFMLAGVEEKAQVKKMMWVYVVGCVVTFGAFGIWKIVVSILQQI